MVEKEGDAMSVRFTTRRDFDCGNYVNEWSVFVVDPSGRHIPELQFDLNDSAKAEAICAAMNKAIEYLQPAYQGWKR